MTDPENKQIRDAYENGTGHFSEKDLDKVLADEKNAQKKASHLGNLFLEFQLLWSLLKDYKTGKYRNIPWKLIASVGFAVAYLILPADVIPDFIPGIGYLDDAAVFGLVLAGFKSEIEAYRKWKNSPDNSSGKDHP